MKTIILAGGLGTRLAEETETRPKPMIEIGHRPILWHIMKGYAHWGYQDFLIALGYKGEHIKRYIADYASLSNNLTVDLGTGTVEAHGGDGDREDWTVTMIDTGRHTDTGGRLLRIAPYLDGTTFMMTFGDGVSDVDVKSLVAFHRSTANSPRSPPCGRPLVSDTSSWKTIRLRSSRRSRNSERDGSTADSSSSSLECSTTSTARTRTSRRSR